MATQKIYFLSNLTWERFFIYFTLSKSQFHLSFIHIYHFDILSLAIWQDVCHSQEPSLRPCSPWVLHSSVVRASNWYSGRSWVQLLLGNSENLFSGKNKVTKKISWHGNILSDSKKNFLRLKLSSWPHKRQLNLKLSIF